ncbi:MAG: UDP-N-acetylglucosamine 1-carboxyvinyltransferase [Candidatus Krumholzibacteriota bacterium]|nr:UDP-N-acetylglucosamine 1-carboxyvinyltransferase [Candidatus Krumholzibacteriota bacterium]
MDSFVIRGPSRLEGGVDVSGAKNAMLPLMAATILTEGRCVLENVPDLRDTATMSELLEGLGVDIDFKGSRLVIDASKIESEEAPYKVVRTMRASIYVLAPLVARCGHARVSLPGGCAWGPRPIDLHLKGLMALGTKIEIDHGYIEAYTEELHGADIVLSVPSVGATVNIMMAAVLARGATTIENAAREPEIVNLAEALRKSGAKINGEGTSRIEIEGVENLSPFNCRVIPDRIEAGTFAAAAVVTGGRIEIRKCNPDHMHAILDKLSECGAEIDIYENRIVVEAPEKIRSVEVETGFYPSFPTDMQAQMMSALCLADGASSVVEHIYPDRFTHVPELKRLGADINIDGRVAIVNGVEELAGAPVMATDIRASSALILAGMAARGKTKVLRVYHIDRGYERIEEKLASLGADITRVGD